MAAKKFEILVLNQISQIGPKRFPAKTYKVAKDAAHPDAILERSHDMNAMKITESVRDRTPGDARHGPSSTPAPRSRYTPRTRAPA